MSVSIADVFSLKPVTKTTDVVSYNLSSLSPPLLRTSASSSISIGPATTKFPALACVAMQLVVNNGQHSFKKRASISARNLLYLQNRISKALVGKSTTGNEPPPPHQAATYARLPSVST